MTPEQLEIEAELLYTERVQERGPAWDQLGEITKGVWRKRVLAGELAELA